MEVLKEFEEYLKENYETNENQNTIRAYMTDVKQFIKFFDEYFEEKILDFSRADYSEYKKYMIDDKQYKYSTINRKTASISIYENFLIEKRIRANEEKIIKKRDFYKIERQLITSDMLPKQVIKKVKLRAGRTSKRDYAMFVLMDDGGLRVSEVLNLQLERDIDFNMYSIHVLGKGNKLRSVFMEQIIYDAIKEYLPEREEKLNGRINKYLFVSNKTSNTNKPMSRTGINNLLEKYCTEINENKINPHIFRHDAATQKYEQNYSDLMLKKFLGHSSNATDIYTHPGCEKYRENKPKQA